VVLSWVAAGCSDKPALPPISRRTCPADIGANACARYQYYMGATDEVFAGLPEPDSRADEGPDVRRKAIEAFTPAQCDEAGKRLRAWMAKATAHRAQIEASSLVPESEQEVLRYGKNKDNFDIDKRDGSLREIRDRCPESSDVMSAIHDAGLFPVTSGVLELTAYKSPN